MSENDKLKEASAAKTEMISIGAHQIRTALSGVKWIIKMLLDGDLGKLSVEQESILEKAQGGNERAIGIINELLLANKSEDVTEKKYSFEKVNMEEMLENVIFDFSGEARSRKIETILLKPTENLAFAKADKDKLRIVLDNLLENAIKYSSEQSKVFITLRQEDNFLEVSFKDTGIGISEAGKAKIFQKYYRDPEAEKKEAVGSGIGLYIVKKIIEAHGGKTWFESKEGEGTTFFFTIPIWA